MMTSFSGLPDETGSQGALRILKMCAEDSSSGPSLVDAILDAAKYDSDYNTDFLKTVAAFAIEGWTRS